MIDHTTRYAREVVKGERVASKLVIQQCEKHIDEVKNGLGGYTFNVSEANKAIKFIELLPDVSTGEPLRLAAFQKFVIGSLYGWLDKLGNRRYSKAYISKSRKNGKSMIISGMAIYELIGGKLPAYNRQIYCTANAKEQAKIVFNMVTQQMNKLMSQSKAIRQHIRKVRTEINHIPSYSIIKPLSKDTSSLDGFNPTLGILDEYHSSNDDSMMEVLESGMIQQPNGLIVIISTAGFNLNGPMYDEYQYAKKLLKGEQKNNGYFTFIAEQDSEKEIHDEDMWIKSNPLLEVDSVRDLMMKNIKDKLTEAQAKNNIHDTLVKNFNLWQSTSEDSYIKGADWEACYIDEPFEQSDRDVYIGVDLARLNDLAALGFIYPTDENKMFVDAHVFVGTKGGLEDKSIRDKIDYQKLADEGYATITELESGIIDYRQIIDHLINTIQESNLNVKGIMYDAWGADLFLAELENRYSHLKLPLIEVGQSFKQLSEPMKQFRLDVYEKKIIHNNNPNISLGINNALVKYDNNANIILDKRKAREKIDTIVALTTAYTQAMFHEFDNSKDMEEYILSDQFGF